MWLFALKEMKADMNKFYPPIDIIEKADRLGYTWLFRNSDGRWYGCRNKIKYNSQLQMFLGVDNESTGYIGPDCMRSAFPYSESIFHIHEWAMKNRQSPDEPSITLTLDEAREMIDAVCKSVEGLFPNMCAENMWIGLPFKKLATFVDAHEEED
jgi:hypothetical protein